MSKVKLGDVAIEHKETCKGSKDGYPIVGLEHLVSEEVTLTAKAMFCSVDAEPISKRQPLRRSTASVPATSR